MSCLDHCTRQSLITWNIDKKQLCGAYLKNVGVVGDFESDQVCLVIVFQRASNLVGVLQVNALGSFLELSPVLDEHRRSCRKTKKRSS